MILKIGKFKLNADVSAKLYHKLNNLQLQRTGSILSFTDCMRILNNIRLLSKYYHEIIDEFDEKEQIFLSSVIYFAFLNEYSKSINNQTDWEIKLLTDTSEVGFSAIEFYFDSFLYKRKLSKKKNNKV